MVDYSSSLLNSLFEKDSLISPVGEVLHFKENLLGGMSLSNSNGTTILETMPNAAGGETVMFDSGETAHLTENIYGSTSLDFIGTTNDIVGRPSIFGQENFFQGGELIGSMKPNFMGDGYQFTDASGETVLSTSPDIFGGTQVAYNPPMIDSNSFGQTFDVHQSFSDVDTISSQISAVDLGSATDMIDGLDFLDLF